MSVRSSRDPPPAAGGGPFGAPPSVPPAPAIDPFGAPASAPAAPMPVVSVPAVPVGARRR